jgi:hypothetical protein
MGPRSPRGDFVAHVHVKCLCELTTDHQPRPEARRRDRRSHRGVEIVLERRQLWALAVLFASGAYADHLVGWNVLHELRALEIRELVLRFRRSLDVLP